MALDYRRFKAQDGAEIYYAEQGTGTPLVYVPGYLDTVETSQSLMARWSERFLCVMFDHRGFGQTPAAPVAGVEQSARDLHDLLEFLDLRDVFFVGYSMGGSVAFSYFEQFGSDRIGRLALVDTTPKLINEGDWNLGLWQGRYTRDNFEFDLRQVRENSPLFHMTFYLHAATLSNPDDDLIFPPADDAEAWLAAIVEKTGLRDRLLRRVFFKETTDEELRQEQAYWDSMTGGDFLRVPPTIDVPTLCLYASPGSFYSPRTGAWLKSQIPNARLDTIEASSHLCAKDQFETFVGKIAEFAGEAAT